MESTALLSEAIDADSRTFNQSAPFEAEAHKSYESAMWDRYEQATGNKRPAEPSQSAGKDEDE